VKIKLADFGLLFASVTLAPRLQKNLATLVYVLYLGGDSDVKGPGKDTASESSQSVGQ